MGTARSLAVDNRLAYMDQASFLGLRALGHGPLGQWTWIYDRPVDMDGLRRFHADLHRGMLGRRIERSPLPFASDRWVSVRTVGDLVVEPVPRPRAEVAAWTDERALVPVDPECGPVFHMSVLPLVDGGAAICMIASHSVADGLGMIVAVSEAADGVTRDLGYPQPRARRRGAAILHDAAATVRAVPTMASAAVAAVRLARKSRADFVSSAAGAPRPSVTGRGGEPARMPSVTVHVDLTEWDNCAKRLHGTSNSMFAGVAARLGARLGRVRPDGLVALSYPVSERTHNDWRANALTAAVITADPRGVTAGLGAIRAELKRTLTELGRQANELYAPLALAPLVPKALARRLTGVALGSADLPIGCSNIGDVHPGVNRPDGTDADRFAVRLIEPGMTVGTVEGIGGHLFIACGRVNGLVFLAVVAYTVGAENSEAALRDQVVSTLADFGLSGTVM